MNRKTLIPYRLISERREEIMGVAILWVVLFHSSVTIRLQPFAMLKSLGYGGVDLFLFLSGMGIWQSLSRHSVSTFFKNRLNRIVPTWWAYLLVWVGVGYWHTRLRVPFQQLLGFAVFTGFWRGLPNQGNWYVYAVMLFYALSPLLYGLIREAKNKTAVGSALLAFALLAALSWRGAMSLNAVSRLPIFIVGMLFSATWQERAVGKRALPAAAALLLGGSALTVGLFLAFPLDRLTETGLYWYPFLLTAPPLCLFLALLFDRSARRAPWLNRALRRLGKASLEILLATDYIFLWTADWIDHGRVSAALTVGAVFIGLVYHLVMERIKAAVKARLS